MKRKYLNMTKAELIKKISELEAEKKNKQKESSPNEFDKLTHELHEKELQVEMKQFELIEKQNQLEESIDKYADLYDFAPTGYITLDSKGSIQEINLTCTNMLGIKRHFAVGVPFIHFLVKDDINRFIDFLKKCKKSNNQLVDEFTLNNKNGFLIIQLTAFSYQDYQTKNSSFRVSVTDITEKKKFELEIKESNERFRLMAEASPVMIWMTDADNNLEYMNNTKLNFLGKTFEELSNDGWVNTRHPEDRKRFSIELLEASLEKRNFSIEVRVINSKGQYKWLLDSAAPRFLPDGTFIGFIGSGVDITERKEIEEKLRQSLKEISEYKYALDESSIVAITDQKGIIKYANENFCKIAKYSREELIGQDHRIINSSYHPKEFIRNLWRTIASGKIWRGELRNRAKDGSIYWVDTTIVPFINEHGKPYQYLAIRSDITEKQNSRIKLEKSLKEKEVLLKEIHHRVKNNLQVISSLLSLQRNYITDPDIQEIFRSSQNRIISMALLHERLYGTKDLVNIDIGDYVKTISKTLLNTYQQSDDIRIIIDIKKIFLDLDTSINLGLIINELVSNSLKYAFKGKKEGEIFISLNYSDNKDELILVVKDDGIGLPRNFNIKQINSLGLELVSSMVEQLNGKLNISRNGKTEFKIIINQKNSVQQD